jgi:hypothetical protein
MLWPSETSPWPLFQKPPPLLPGVEMKVCVFVSLPPAYV